MAEKITYENCTIAVSMGNNPEIILIDRGGDIQQDIGELLDYCYTIDRDSITKIPNEYNLSGNPVAGVYKANITFCFIDSFNGETTEYDYNISVEIISKLNIL